MKHTQNPTALRQRSNRLALALLLTLAGCALPSAPERPRVYDFGSGRLTPADVRQPQPTPLAVADIEAPAALDSTAVLYRLVYANAQQLQPYALARWSMTPARLLRQRLREQLSQQRAVLNPGDSVALAGAPTQTTPARTLRLELEEFSQLFESPQQSLGLLRLRATVLQAGPGGEKLLAQRNLVVQRPAPSADAPGGVQALSAAADAAVQELTQWLAGLPP